MVEVILGFTIASLVFTIGLFIYTQLLDRDLRPLLSRRFGFIKLPFKLPYKYSLGSWDKSALHTKNQCREIVIKGKITRWFGYLTVGVKENGLWGYTTFFLKGVGIKDGFQLEPDTDLIRLLNEGKEFSRIFTDQGIALEMESTLGEQMKDLETKINNLKVIERLNDEADRIE